VKGEVPFCDRTYLKRKRQISVPWITFPPSQRGWACDFRLEKKHDPIGGRQKHPVSNQLPESEGLQQRRGSAPVRRRKEKPGSSKRSSCANLSFQKSHQREKINKRVVLYSPGKG